MGLCAAVLPRPSGAMVAVGQREGAKGQFPYSSSQSHWERTEPLAWGCLRRVAGGILSELWETVIPEGQSHGSTGCFGAQVPSQGPGPHT